MRRRDFLVVLPSALAGARLLAAAPGPSRYRIYFGNRGQLQTKDEGIYLCLFDPSTGRCGDVTLAAKLQRATWQTVSRDGRYLYSVDEAGGYIVGFAVNQKTGGLERINQVSSDPRSGTMYVGTTYVSLDMTGKVALAANMRTGSTASFRVLSDGRLSPRVSHMQHSLTRQGPNPRQTEPHAHATVVSPDNRFVLAPDLGADKVYIYRLDVSRGALAANDPAFVQLPPGSGPRHLAFHPDGRFAYLITEFTAHLVAFSWDSGSGCLEELQAVDACPKGHEGKADAAEIQVDRAGRFVYASIRADSTLAVFAIDRAKGTLAAVERVPSGGKNPWSLRLDPSGGYLLAINQASDEATLFLVDAQTGRLTRTGEVIKVPAPSCAVFVAV